MCQCLSFMLFAASVGMLVFSVVFDLIVVIVGR